jgi:hypothetical protein
MNFSPELNDVLTSASILLTFFIALMSLIISWRNSRKTTFINSVTASRIKWIDTIRNNISEFCGQVHHLSLTPLRDDEKKPIIEKIDRLRFLIKLQLNRSDNFDKKIIDKINLILNLTYLHKNNELTKEINELVELTQDLLKLEWEGVKEESKKGDLTKKRKKELYEKYLQTEKQTN